MIDFHSHVVYDVDDGAKTLENSIDMIKEAKNAGFTDIILTPHYMENYFEKDSKQIKQKIEIIQEELEKQNVKINLYQGNEIYISSDIIENIKNDLCVTLNNSKYVLFELPMNNMPHNLEEVIYLILSDKKIPVIAHPERYEYIQKNPNILIDLIDEGVLLQANYGSIIGQFGKNAKKTLEKLLRNNMIHFFGTDVHRKESLYTKMEEIIKELKKILPEHRIEELTTLNPKLVIENKKIEINYPTRIKESFIEKILKK